jgi:hypothetical protein
MGSGWSVLPCSNEEKGELAMMKKTVSVCSVLAAVWGAFALDTAQNDDYWNTSAYVNPQTVTVLAVSATAFESSVEVSHVTKAVDRFCTCPVGLSLVIR